MTITYKIDKDVVTKITTIEEVFNLKTIEDEIKDKDKIISDLKLTKLIIDEKDKVELKEAIIDKNLKIDKEIEMITGERIEKEVLLEKIKNDSNYNDISKT